MLNLKSNFHRGVYKAPVQIKWHSVASNDFPDLSWVHPIKLATKQNNDAPIPSQKHNLKKKEFGLHSSDLHCRASTDDV